MAFHGHVCLPRRHDEHVAPWSRPRDHTPRQLGTSLNPFFRLGWNLLKSPLQSVCFKQAHKFILASNILKLKKCLINLKTIILRRGPSLNSTATRLPWGWPDMAVDYWYTKGCDIIAKPQTFWHLCQLPMAKEQWFCQSARIIQNARPKENGKGEWDCPAGRWYSMQWGNLTPEMIGNSQNDRGGTLQLSDWQTIVQPMARGQTATPLPLPGSSNATQRAINAVKN